ncbi:ATP-binding protein [Roseateles sp. DC23W]|uniref:histidine kinase n=1 Tax=Pelomonas dachongensis TaxID=3299029 RepID=A0ABW7EQN4_9BURK
MRKLTEISRALTYAVSLEEVLDLTVDRAAELLDAPRVVLMLTNDEGLLAVRASFGLDVDAHSDFQEPLQDALITRLKLLLGTTEQEPFLGVPLVVAGEVTGLLAVAMRPSSSLPEDDEWLLSALADQAAVALEKTRLDQTAEFRERLIGIVSHDLRNPVSVIKMTATLLRRWERLDPRTVDDLIARVHRSADQVTAMIHELLDFTQARLGGSIPLARKPGDLHAVVRQVVEEFGIAHPGRTFELQYEGDAQGSWDAGRLTQVVGNLLSNAVSYSPAGSVVKVSSRVDSGMVALVIQNDGPPIRPDLLPNLFEPMQRASSELDNASRSVGLGLYIVKHVVQAHGGTVAVRSEHGLGTELTVTLPLKAD